VADHYTKRCCNRGVGAGISESAVHVAQDAESGQSDDGTMQLATDRQELGPFQQHVERDQVRRKIIMATSFGILSMLWQG
jgi:Zn-dependent oligopeptidase